MFHLSKYRVSADRISSWCATRGTVKSFSPVLIVSILCCYVKKADPNAIYSYALNNGGLCFRVLFKALSSNSVKSMRQSRVPISKIAQYN